MSIVSSIVYARGGQPFSARVPKSAKSMTKFFRVPTTTCENILLDILKGVWKSLEEIVQIHPNSENAI